MAVLRKNPIRASRTDVNCCIRLIHIFFVSRAALVAESAFLRKQLALFAERKVKPRRTTPIFRLAMIILGRFFDWRSAQNVLAPRHAEFPDIHFVDHMQEQRSVFGKITWRF